MVCCADKKPEKLKQKIMHDRILNFMRPLRFLF
jgi:hypothetical protein